MKCVFTTAMTHYPWAGSEELWGRAALYLAQKGHKVSALVPRYDPLAPRLQELQSAGATLQLMAPKRARWPVRLWRELERKWRTHMDADLAWIKSQRPDIVCVSNGNYYDGLFYMEFCAAQGIPYVGVAQANAEWLWPGDATADRIRATYDRARAVFFVAEHNLRMAETQLGARLTRAEVVRNPFNVTWGASPAWPGDGGLTRLDCVARYEPSAKGQDLLFEVMAMEKWRSRPVVVSLFGAGPMERSLKRLVERLGLQGKVHFRGHVNDVESIWREHHALVLPSRYEGLPLAIVEAMLCGRPCLVTDVAGNAELLEDNVTGFVAEAPTVKSLDQALERAWRARAEWREIGRRASESVISSVPADPAAVFAQKLIELA